jgi:hypothetical protein
MWNFLFTFASLILLPATASGSPAGYSLRFHGTGSGDVDRVKIPLGGPSRPVNIGGDFTLEFWMRALPGENNGIHGVYGGGDGWITGNVILDRDVFGSGDNGDFGISLAANGALAFGVDRQGNGNTIYTTGVNLADGQWHHVAATRSTTSGQIRLYVDGIERASGSGPTGNVAYRSGRTTAYPNSDPFLVLGAEKHDYAPEFPSFSGWLDELRISTTIRYTGSFTPADSPFLPDAQTVALYHFDEGHGPDIHDTANATGGPSHGERKSGGNVAGSPLWSSLSPFSIAADHDGDGLRDWFEVRWFGSTTAGVAPLDNDGDGHDNLREMIAGTSPLDPKSRFHAEFLARENGLVRLQISTVPEKQYRPLRALSPEGPWQPAAAAFTASTNQTIVECPDPGGERQFWTVTTSP